jgi:hypothetical protein
MAKEPLFARVKPNNGSSGDPSGGALRTGRVAGRYTHKAALCALACQLPVSQSEELQINV